MTPPEEPAGTSLAVAPDVGESLQRAVNPETVWRGHRNQQFFEEAPRTSRRVIALGLLVQLGLLALFVHAGYEPWRIAVVGAIYVAFAIAQRTVMGCVADSTRVELAFIRMNIMAQLFVVTEAAVTGGLNSPFLPTLVLPAIVSLLFFGPYPAARWTAVGNGLLILAMALLPEAVVGPRLADPHYTVAILISFGWFLVVLHMMVGKLTTMSTRAGDSMACLREERITEAVAQLRRLQSVGAKVAHELKNPLASVKGLCQLVARTPESERTQERLAVVASEISRMETILQEYLSFSRPLEDLKLEAVDLHAIARDVLEVVAGRADQAGVALELDGVATEVSGDPRRLKEALINLVSNAIEATPSGGRVCMRLRATATQVTLEVRDTGRGIAPEDHARLGTSFFTTRPDGTGLGVVLAQSAITQHGGTLGYQSTLGKGTTATITLPTLAAAAASPAPRDGDATHAADADDGHARAGDPASRFESPGEPRPSAGPPDPGASP